MGDTGDRQGAAAEPPSDLAAVFAAAVCSHQAGRLAEAQGLYQQALALDPDHVGSLHNLGILARQSGRGEQAVALIGRAAALNQDEPSFQLSLGAALRAVGRDDEAVGAYRRAVALRPDHAEAHAGLGAALLALGEAAAAETAYRRAAELEPGQAEAHARVGDALQLQGRFAPSVAAYRRSLALKPGLSQVWINLANALQALGRFEEAADACRNVLAAEPGNSIGYVTLGAAFARAGRLEEADGAFLLAIAADPDNAAAYSNRLFSLNYAPDKSAQNIFAAYRDYDARFGRPLRRPDPQPTPVAERKLRIGYVSPDFRAHPCRHFLEPVFAHHDRNSFVIHAYAQSVRDDDVTERYRQLSDAFVRTNDLSDDQLFDRIRADDIDILVDLAGHTDGARLGVFARKPAPVSVSWLGSGYTTGLSAVDYFLSDAAMAPAGSEDLFSETPWRLKAAYVYRPAEGMGEPGPLPAAARGHVVFGALTRAIRINRHTVRVWARLLERVEGARLAINSRDFQDRSMQHRLADAFGAHGIERERLQIGFSTPPWDLLRGIDIGLDCFPHNSGTTLFESLYMGLPFVTLAGRPSVGRLGSSILTALGRPDWIAQDEDAYVEIAAALAADPEALAEIRAGLRGRMQASPLMDEAGFVRDLEAAYRRMWARR